MTHLMRDIETFDQLFQGEKSEIPKHTTQENKFQMNFLKNNPSKEDNVEYLPSG